MHTYAIAVAFVILVALVTIGNPAFLSPSNLANMLGQWAPAGIMAVAMTYVIIARGFDLSVSSGFSLCAIVAAATAADGHGTVFAFAAAIVAGLAIGLFNALLVCGLSINPFIATVGAGFIFLGWTSSPRQTRRSVSMSPASTRSAPAVGTEFLIRE